MNTQEPQKPKLQIKPQSVKSTSMRWVILFFACMVLMGDAFSFDNPQSLETQLERVFDINQVEFNLLYSVYSIPNIILPLFGGYLIDHCGVRVNIVLFATLLVLGQFIFALSVTKRLFWLAVVGRLIFGIGSECLTISQTSLVSYWFGYSELSLAVGLNLSVPRLGGALNSYIIPKIYERHQRVEDAMFFSTLICFTCSLVCGLALVLIDKHFRNDQMGSPAASPGVDKRNTSVQSAQVQLSMRSSRSIRPFENIFEMYPKYGVKPETENVNQIVKEASGKDDEEKETVLSSPKKDPEPPKPVPYEIDEKLQSRKNLDSKQKFVEQKPIHEEGEKVLFSQIKEMPKVFWLLLIISSISESLFIPFLNNANKLYQTRFGFSNIRAGEILVIPYIAACISTPFVGIFMSFKGNNPRAKYIVISAMAFLITHVSFAFLPNCINECIISVIPLIMLGICFSGFASVIMPSIPIFINDEKILGTAFGLVAIAQNLLLSLFPLISAQVFESVEEDSSSEAGFQYVSALFVIMSAVLMAVSILLYFKWSKNDKVHKKRPNTNDLSVKRQVTSPDGKAQPNQHSNVISGGKSQQSLSARDSKSKEKELFNLEIKELNVKDIFE